MGEIRFKCSSCGQAMIADSSLSGKKWCVLPAEQK